MAGLRWWPTWAWLGSPPADDFEARPWEGEEFAPSPWRILYSGQGDGRLYLRFMLVLDGLVHAGPAIDILDVAQAGFDAPGIARALEAVTPDAEKLSGAALRPGTVPRDRLTDTALYPTINAWLLRTILTEDYRGNFTPWNSDNQIMRTDALWGDGTGIRRLRVSPTGWTGPTADDIHQDDAWKWARVVEGGVLRIRLPGQTSGGAHFWITGVGAGGEGNQAHFEFTLSHLQGTVGSFSASDAWMFSVLLLPPWLPAPLIDGLVEHGQINIGAIQAYAQLTRTSTLLLSQGGMILRVEIGTLDGLVQPDQMTRIDLAGYRWVQGGSVLAAGQIMPTAQGSLAVGAGFQLRGLAAHIAYVLRYTAAGFWFQIETAAGAIVTEGLVLAINVLSAAQGTVQFSTQRQNIYEATLAADTNLRIRFSGSGARHDEFTQALGSSKTRAPSEHAVREALENAGSTLPASAGDGRQFVLTAADGGNSAGLYYRINGAWQQVGDAA